MNDADDHALGCFRRRYNWARNQRSQRIWEPACVWYGEAAVLNEYFPRWEGYRALPEFREGE